MGVLSYQGSVKEHADSLNKLKQEVIFVKNKKTLYEIDGLIIPGGESTTIGRLLKLDSLDKYLIKRIIEDKLPVYGTCAGLILLSKEIENGKKWQNLLKVLDVKVERNGFGRQVDSFEAKIEIPELNIKNFSAVFIRAPIIKEVLSEKVEILAYFDNKVVFVRQGNILASSFHPELTNDLSIHRYFINIVKQRKLRRFK